MAQGDKTDPLARYTSTGSGSSSMPANPYKAKGQNAYWNGKQWVPFNNTSNLPTVAKRQQAMPDLGFWNTVRDASRSVAGTLVALPASLGSREAASEVGTMFGNAISNIPGVRNVAGSGVAGKAAYGAQSIMGTENLQDAVSDLYSGNPVGAAGNYGMWFGQNLTNAIAGGPGTKGAVAGAKALGVKGIVPGFVQGLKGYSQITKKQIPGQLINLLFSGKAALDIAGGRGEKEAAAQAAAARAQGGGATTGATPAPGQMLPADRYEEMKKREQAQQAFDYLRTPQYTTTPYGSTIKQTFTDANGLVNTWNPRTKMYEVTGTVTPGTTGVGGAPILGLSAAQQLEFDNRLRDIEAETQAVLSGLSGQASSARAEAKQGREASRRQVAGGSQDLASGLAFLGLDTSPGVLDVGQEFQARAGAEREAGIAKSLAQTIADVSSRSAEAKRRQEREKRDLAAKRLQLEEENILKKQEEAYWNTFLGGGK